MIEVRQTAVFRNWMADLRDGAGRKVIGRRIARLTLGAFGDVKSVGDGVSELRIDFGPGYRLYFARRGLAVIVLLCGGDKDDQPRDIARARAMAAELE